jgi:heme exporter protein C
LEVRVLPPQPALGPLPVSNDFGGTAAGNRSFSAKNHPVRVAKALLLPYMAAVIAAAFLWPEPAQGFIGESSRIVFFHVPCAWTASLAFLVAAGYSVAYLAKRDPRYDDLAAAAVRLGLLFAVLALATGSLFAKIMWGSYWNWDPRESSFLLLVFLYAAYLFLREAVDDRERRGRMAAAYALFAAVLMPFLTFVAPRITQSLHPQTVINPEGKVLMDLPTKTVFFGGLVGFSALFFWMLSITARAARLERSRRLPGGSSAHQKKV